MTKGHLSGGDRNPVEQIRTIAEDEDVSIIAMSSVGKDTMYTGRIDSMTYYMANIANRPVLVVRVKPIYAVLRLDGSGNMIDLD